MTYHPGPDALERDRAPGGLIVHVYDRTGFLLLERALRAGHIGTDAAEALAAADTAAVAEAGGGGDVCLVVYDGDTGQRAPIEVWRDAARDLE